MSLLDAFYGMQTAGVNSLKIVVTTVRTSVVYECAMSLIVRLVRLLHNSVFFNT
jgi:hypothetical protein